MQRCIILNGFRYFASVSISKVAEVFCSSEVFSAQIFEKICCICLSSLSSGFFWAFRLLSFISCSHTFLRSFVICFWRCLVFCMPRTAKNVRSNGIIKSILSITQRKMSSADISLAQRASRSMFAILKDAITCSSIFLFLARLIYFILLKILNLLSKITF